MLISLLSLIYYITLFFASSSYYSDHIFVLYSRPFLFLFLFPSSLYLLFFLHGLFHFLLPTFYLSVPSFYFHFSWSHPNSIFCFHSCLFVLASLFLLIIFSFSTSLYFNPILFPPRLCWPVHVCVYGKDIFEGSKKRTFGKLNKKVRKWLKEIHSG